MEGPDHRASLEPHELTNMVKAIRNTEIALGNNIKQPSDSEKKNIAVARKSIHVSKKLPKGHALSEDDMIMMRPGDGISPMKYKDIIGRKLAINVESFHKLKMTELT